MITGPWARPRGIRVPARSTGEIREAALNARLGLGINEPCINMIDLLENRLRKIGIRFHVVENHLLPDEAAKAIPEQGRILVCRDAYDAIYDGDVKQQLLIPHEFGHFVLKHTITLARATSLTPHPAVEDSEVQADLFSHEFALPVELIRRHCHSIADIERAFRVPELDARIRADTLRRENLIDW
ncbi:MAG: ImmA/IrrE family metallo-endopeptidase [Betaproteobacteria bacterium]|nr:ImmA/IrrE family metallo-endopeptidase [Betaproteobacteria bacterium]